MRFLTPDLLLTIHRIMRLFTLGARLETAASFIPEGAAVADIGTDHARLPIWLVKTGRCSHVIASDVADTPVQRARDNVERWGVAEAIQIVQCAGFDSIAPGSFTHAVICGMGGDTISSILMAAPWTADAPYTLILQAETAARRLREFLYTHGYTICQEIAVLDGGRVYSVIEARGGLDPHRSDPLYARISAPLLRQHDSAARLYAARVKKSLMREMQGMQQCSEPYRNAEALLERILEWETENG